jgi:hypothetical protein
MLNNLQLALLNNIKSKNLIISLLEILNSEFVWVVLILKFLNARFA